MRKKKKEIIRFFSNLRLVNKVLFLVSLLGMLAVIITLFSMHNMRQVDRDYRDLLNYDAAASILIGDALLDLSDASRLVFSVLTEQEELKMRATQQDLDNFQAQFRSRIEALRPLIRDHQTELDNILAQEARVFQLAASIIDAAARWRGDRALEIIHQQLDPDLRTLRHSMDQLRDSSIKHYQEASSALHESTHRAMSYTAIAFGLAILLVISLSAYLSITQISNPIVHLTRAMGQLTNRQYDSEIPNIERSDEVGQMAKAMELFRATMQRADHLEALILTDPLTGIANRRAFDQTLEQEWGRSQRLGLSLSFVMMDIDCFKQFNDNYGHGTGDECLVRVAKALKSALQRPGDFVARYGGEEFVAVLSDTDLAGAMHMAERFHAAVAEQQIPHAFSKAAPHITISAGIAAAIPAPGLETKMLAERADEMLYAAKNAGRNTTKGVSLHASLVKQA